MISDLLISIVMGSDSDLPIMKEAAEVLEELGIPNEAIITSAHRTPLDTENFAVNAVDRGVKVIIAGAGGAAHLPGVIAAFTTLPVIGVPIQTPTLNGVDSLYSIVQMPKGIPVATMSINGARNAGIFAAQILAVENEIVQGRLIKFRENAAQKVRQKNCRLQDVGVNKYLQKN